MIPELIYCAGGNARFAQIAIDSGFLYGSQLPATVYFPPYFADQNWKSPNREAYMAALQKHSPHIATVLDLERAEQLQEVLSWAEEAARFVRVVIIIPKAFGIIPAIPNKIGGADIRLGYSVPTKYAGTEVPIWEFNGWPVHLLGGSPQKQMELTAYLDVKSVDGNMAQKMAVKRAMFWQPGTARYAVNRYWPQLKDIGIAEVQDAPYVAFEMSCKAIYEAWQEWGARKQPPLY